MGRTADCKRTKDIWKRIENRLTLWTEGKHTMLVEDTVQTSMGLISLYLRAMTDDQLAKTYTPMVLQGKLGQTVWFVMNCDKGGVLHGTDIDAKSGKTVCIHGT